jgi:adenylate cyclase class 2
MQNIEIELKFKLENPTELQQKLQTMATLVKENEYQKDSYFVPSHRNFLDIKPISERLRVRTGEKGSSINYKHWLYEGGQKAVSCDEFETKVEDIEAMTHILAALNFTPIIIVEKQRTTWHYKQTEIAIDTVSDLGTYIEIEAKGEFESKEDAITYVYSIAKELEADLGEQDYRGYPYRLLEKSGYSF